MKISGVDETPQNCPHPNISDPDSFQKSTKGLNKVAPSPKYSGHWLPGSDTQLGGDYGEPPIPQRLPIPGFCQATIWGGDKARISGITPSMGY